MWVPRNIMEEEQIKTKPNLSVLALISFIVSFAVARIFTSLYPSVFWEISSIHIHHFWYGLAMLAIGGWLGISVENERVNRIAAILFGSGGGLIGDEVGLLLTLESESYWAEITYTFVILFLTFVSLVILINKYSKIIRAELAQFVGSNASLYFGVFLLAVSIAFILETDEVLIIAISSAATVIALAVILAYFVLRAKRK